MSYNVGFLDGGVVKKVIKVTASNKDTAYSKAEEIYKKLGWQFRYNDMFCDLLKG